MSAGAYRRKTEGGQGGRVGHGNMSHCEPTEDVKMKTRVARRVNNKRIIQDAIREMEEEDAENHAKWQKEMDALNEDLLQESSWQAVMDSFYHDEGIILDRGSFD